MSPATQNSLSTTETLKARKAHLAGLLEVIVTKTEKNTAIQKLTITAIKAEMELIEHKLEKR